MTSSARDYLTFSILFNLTSTNLYFPLYDHQVSEEFYVHCLFNHCLDPLNLFQSAFIYI